MGLWTDLSNFAHNVIHNPFDWSTEDKGHKGLFDLTTDALGIRKASLEDALVLAGNYFIPGSSLITSQFVSDEAKRDLSSGKGTLAQLLSGGAGAGWGSSTTGIPQSPFVGAPVAGTEGTMGPPAPAGLGENFVGPMPSADVAYTSPVAPYGDVSGTDIGFQGSAPTGSENPLYSTMDSGNYGLSASAGPGYSVGTGGGSYGVANPSEGYFSGIGPGSSEWSLEDLAKRGWEYAKKNPGKVARGAAGVYDLYAKTQMSKEAMNRYNQNEAALSSYYAPGSAEHAALAKEMARKDAAAGRNSQYGTRAVDLAAKTAGIRANARTSAMPYQNALANSAQQNKYGSLNSLFYLAGL